jgi:hypothetical protein
MAWIADPGSSNAEIWRAMHTHIQCAETREYGVTANQRSAHTHTPGMPVVINIMSLGAPSLIRGLCTQHHGVSRHLSQPCAPVSCVVLLFPLLFVLNSSCHVRDDLHGHTLELSLCAIGNGVVNKTIGTTQREASDTIQEQSTDEKNQTDRIRHHKRCRRSGGVATGINTCIPWYSRIP